MASLGSPGALSPTRQEGSSRYQNRELSLLDFESRLLDLAEDEGAPLLERVKFLAIFSSGIDELFEVRVAGIKDRVAAGLRAVSPDGRSPIEQLRVIRSKLEGLLSRQSRIYLDKLVPALGEAGVCLVDWEALDGDDRCHLDQVFEHQIFPVLTPLAVDTAHPFPYISNLSLNLAVTVRDPYTREQRFARIKVPPLLPRFVAMPDGARNVAVEQVIAAHLDSLFPEMTIESHYTFRVTRNADLTLEEGEADDLLVAVEMELRRRRFGRAVRLEIETQAGADVRELLTRELEIGPEDVYDIEGPLDLGGLMALYDLDRGDLHYEPWAPMTQPRLATAEDEPVDLFAVLRERDVLVHHPYDSFATSVEAFVAQAACDPSVLAIKQTLYRTSGHSPIVRSLIKAAEQGKQVAVLVELKARGDEQANIAWARALEEVGVHVVYGLVGFKTHAKAILVVRAEEDGLRRYCHVGTGNYNSKTAALYEDLGLLSADPDLGADLTDLFNFLTGYSRRSSYRRLAVAPTGMRTRIIEAIEGEGLAGTDGRIVIKVNGLTDPMVIDALYEASGKAVPIDLVVRGVCRLRPGVAGLSETIQVRSVVGRFLEHSRIFSFGGVAGRPSEILIGSADLMERNLDRRIEAMIPVVDAEARLRLSETLDLLLADDAQSWIMASDGSWSRVRVAGGAGDGQSAQLRQQELAMERARRRRRDSDSLSSSGGQERLSEGASNAPQ
ncbi:MAG: polyphosphate kinase 1 [Acidimicrobiales bacterium]|nr:MAG: polyphosphate kinase 1 [Acidimicrobiales bacterium]